MNDHDDARDLHAALGGLLVDEPTAPWSAQDDVARGRALQHRRRTRTLGGIGLAAALALVVGMLGPWAPTPRTTPPASPSADLEQQVTDALAGLGWETDSVARVRTEPGSPEVRAWTVHRAEGDAGVKATLVLHTWDAASFPDGEVPEGRLSAACRGDGACGLFDTFLQDCSGGPCWTKAETVVRRQYDTLPVGSAIVSSWSLSPRVAVEIAATPPASDGSAPDPLETAAFLTQAERNQLLGVVQTWLLAQPDEAPGPTPTPTSSSGPEPGGIAAVTQVLEGFGFRVKSAQGFSGRDGWYFDVDVDPTADNPVDAVLTLAFFPENLAVGTERVAVQGSVMNGCDEQTCLPVASFTVPCPSNACFQDWSTTTTDAYGGVDEGTLVVFRSNGSRAIEAVVGVRSCTTCAPSRVDGAFLTLEQTQQVLSAAFASTAPSPAGSQEAEGTGGVDEVLAAAGITVAGGPDWAGKGPSEQWQGEYLLTRDRVDASVQVRILSGTGANERGCATPCDPDSTSSGLGYEQQQTVLTATAPEGPPGTRLVERWYDDSVFVSVTIRPWGDGAKPALDAELADSFVSAVVREFRDEAVIAAAA